MQRDVNKMGLAYSLMLSLTGTPVVYYGDEFGKFNDEKYYREQIKLTGKDDTRFLVRGRVDWDDIERVLRDEDNFHTRVYRMISSMLSARNSVNVFGRGDTRFLESQKEILSYVRELNGEKVLVVNNLSDTDQRIEHPFPNNDLVILHLEEFTMDDLSNSMKFGPHGFAWFKILD